MSFVTVGEDESQRKGKDMTAVSSGVIYIHSAPRALTSHIEWAISRVLGKGVTFLWSSQPLLDKTVRTEYVWQGPAGSGATLASSLHGWSQVRFEITENSTDVSNAGRWCHTPSLGIFHAVMDASGNTVVNENALLHVLDVAGTDAQLLRTGISRLLGTQWDAELDVFRNASDEAPVKWLYQVS